MIMKHFQKSILTLLAAVGGISLVFGYAIAASPLEEFQQSLQTGEVIQNNLPTNTDELTSNFFGTAMSRVLPLIGSAMLVVFIYAGFLWASARGNEEQIKKAKKILVGAILGLLILALAAVTVNWILNTLAVLN
jgi:hypothetical protein